MKLKILMMIFIIKQLFSQTITLENAIEIAINEGKEITISENDLNISKKKLSSAFKIALPNLFYTGAYLKADTPILENIPIKVKNSGYVNFIGISQPIFQGGAIIAEMKGAKIAETQSVLNYLKTKRDVRLEIISIYCEILAAKNTIEAYTISKNQLTEVLNSQKEKIKIGKATNSDILKAEYQLLEMEANIIDTQNILEIGMISLKQKLNLSSNISIDIEEFTIPKEILSFIDYERDLKEALNKSIASNLAKTMIEDAEVLKMATRADFLPHAKVFIGKGSVTEEDETNSSWGGGVLVNWDIFHFGKDYDNYKAAEFEIEKAKLQEKLTTDSIELNLRKAYLDIIKINKLMEVRFKALEEAEENFQRDKDKFERGIISFLDFLISQAAVTDSRVKYNNLKFYLFTSFERYRSLLI